MLLQDLFAAKGCDNPLLKLVNNFTKMDAVLSSTRSTFLPESTENRVATKLDVTKGLIAELKKLISKDEPGKKIDLANLDLTEANRIFETLDNEASIMLQVMLEGAWEQVQEHSKVVEEFVREVLIAEEREHKKTEFFYALKRQNTEQAKEILKEETSLDVVLDYLQTVLAREHFLGISVLATKIIDDFPAFKQVHYGVDWSGLARLQGVSESLNTKTYSTLPKLVSYALTQTEIHKELDNLNKAIGYIRTDPFYKQTAPILQHLSALVNFTYDVETLFRLKNYLEGADIQSLGYQMTNHTVDTHTPAPFRDSFISLISRSTNKVKDFDSIGRIHNVMTVADIGEILGQLSSQMQEYFNPGIGGEIKKLRNIIFHPERDSNWENLKEMISNGQNPYTQDFFIEVIRNYEIAAEVYHFLAGRTYQREEILGFSIDKLFGNEEAFVKKVLVHIPENLHQYYYQYYRYVQSHQFLHAPILPPNVLWDHIKGVVKSPPNITNLGSQMTPETINKIVEAYLKEKIAHIKSCSFDKVSREDLDFLDKFFKDGPSTFQVMEKDYLTLKYHVLLQGKISSQEEVAQILKSLQGSNYFSVWQLLESHIARKFADLGSSVDTAQIDEWKHLEKILLTKRILEHEDAIKKLDEKLKENKDKYEAALLKTQRSKKEDSIVANNLRLEAEYTKAQQEKAAIMDKMLRVDDVYLQGQFLYPDALLQHITGVLNVSSSVINLENQSIIKKVEAYLKEKIEYIKSCSFDKVSKEDLDFLDKFFKDNSSTFQAMEKDYLTLKYHVLLQGKISSQEELLKILDTLQNSNYFDVQKDKQGALEKYIVKKLADLKSGIELTKIKEWKHLEKILLIKHLLKVNEDIKKLSNTLEKNKEKYEIALSKTTKTPEEDKILVDYPKVEGIRTETQQNQASIINSILSIDNITEQISSLCVLAYASDTILPRLLFSLEKINHYYESSKNPPVTAVSTNSVNPSYSALEFFTMLAGSLVRWYRDYNDNTPLQHLDEQVKVLIGKEEFSLSQVMKKLQEFRGNIAHAHTPQDGHTFQFMPFLYLKYDQYATACQKPLLDILRITISQESESILAKLQDHFLHHANISKEIFVGAFMKMVTISPDLIARFLQNDTIKIHLTEQDKYLMIKTAIETLDNMLSEKITGRVDIVHTHLESIKELTTNDVWYMIIERLLNSPNFSKTVTTQECHEGLLKAIEKNKPDIVISFLMQKPELLEQMNEHGWGIVQKYAENTVLNTQYSFTLIIGAAKHSNIECLKTLVYNNIYSTLARDEIFDSMSLISQLGKQYSGYCADNPRILRLSLENDHLVILTGEQKVYDFDA